MKVICIDAGNRVGETANKYLIEGQEYTIRQYWGCCFKQGIIVYEPVYTLMEIDPQWGFSVDRFVPLSSIDETEFERSYNKELV